MLIPPPPPPACPGLPVALVDTECYPNYWLLKFRTLTTRVVFTFKIADGQAFDQQTIATMRNLLSQFKIITFNGNGYDMWMIGAALNGYNTSQLKWLNDAMIVEKQKPWNLGLKSYQPGDHIDIMEVCPGAGSLKFLAARVHTKSIRDLPYTPDTVLTVEQQQHVDVYCENDLDDLEDLWNECQPHIAMRESLSERYGIDLRSKSDAQLAEKVIWSECERITGERIYKRDVDWNLKFKYKAPEYLQFSTPQLQNALNICTNTVFGLSASGRVELPLQLDNLRIPLGQSVYRMGIGGLHSSESTVAHHTDEHFVLIDNDVASYYPSLILTSGAWPKALGPAFLQVFGLIKEERLTAKALAKKLKAQGFVGTVEYIKASTEDGGGKIMINGTFGKTGSPFSILFAPEMLIQTTITGQLSLLMLIEWFESYGIPVISANTDGVVAKCPRHLVPTLNALVAEWQKRTGLTMEAAEYKAIYSRDVNNYVAIKADGEVKRKGEFAKSGLDEKKSPSCEICADAVVAYLSEGIPVEYTVATCTDIRKFVTVQKVSGGGVKLWGEGPRKDALVRDMEPVLITNGWVKVGRMWKQGDGPALPAVTAYKQCFAPQTREYLGKVVRWYYSTQAPGPIVYATNGNTVSLSYGAKPCMVLPDTFPDDIDYQWYIQESYKMLLTAGAIANSIGSSTT